MGKYILIALDKATAEEREAITNFVVAKQWGYWHWFQDLWILPSAGIPSNVTAKSVYEEFEKIPALKTTTAIVMAFNEPPEYFGRANPDAWKWMNQHGGRVV